MGIEPSGSPTRKLQAPFLKRANARITVKPYKDGTFGAPSHKLAEKDSCLLLPCGTVSPSSSDAVAATPLVSDLVRRGVACFPKINFRGWTPPGLGWEAWVRDMGSDQKVVKAWREAEIEDAILGSVNYIKPDQSLLEALSGFWCPVTRTFIFPWGEATFTLEDAYVIGNLPISGSRFDRELTDEENDRMIRLYVEKEKIRELHPKAKSLRRVTLDIWLQWFLELHGEDDLKYLGFLTYWLSKNVLPPYPYGEVPKMVFGLAARLSCGDRIALASLVTANIYHDLSNISNFVLNSSRKRRSNKVDVWAQFGLLQVWVWARFESLCPLPLGAGPLVSEPCISSRPGNKASAMNYDEALSIFQDEKAFAWRPFSLKSSWKEPPWYDEQMRKIHVEDNMPAWAYDYVAITSPSTLQGFFGDDLISSERYQPHRVARQFGYDQSIPVASDSLATCIADNHHKIGEYVMIPKLTRSGVPRREYLVWWQKRQLEYRQTIDKFGSVPSLLDILQTQTKAKDKNPVEDFAVGGTNFGEHESQNNELHKCSKRKRESKDKHNSSSSELDEFSKGSKFEADCINMNEETLSVPSRDVIVLDVHSDNSVIDSEEEQRRLVDELEEFLCCGLLAEWEPSSPGPDNEKNCWNCSIDNVGNYEDPYGQEAIRMYPQFFKLIPQKPHYRGLLDDNVSEEVKHDVHLSKWYRLIDLTRKALETTCQTDPLEVENLMVEARKFEGFGFNVKHVIARLKEPKIRLKRLEDARSRLEDAKGREKHAQEMLAFRKHVNDLGSQLREIEEKIDKTREAFGMTELGFDTNSRNLREEVETAEANLRAIEHKVESMNNNAQKSRFKTID